MMWSARLPVATEGLELPHAAIRSASESVAPAARPYLSSDRRVTAASDQYRGPCPIEVLLLLLRESRRAGGARAARSACRNGIPLRQATARPAPCQDDLTARAHARAASRSVPI